MESATDSALDSWDDDPNESLFALPQTVTRPEVSERFAVIIDGTRYPLELGVEIEEFKRSIVATAQSGGGFLTIPGLGGNYSAFVSAGLGLLIERVRRDESPG
ncbi:hypothetical protein ELQ92_08560 [Labedella populi]|uniref:Uncharacterized protein n=1 Tax=Labedella populi TaxID=2498850 RepID=A0A3S3ZR82_9MICO|nr:hypothetical protein [Labedella populi]RWZ61088.1 hypothetical protein ELQ92_08560 [Labedella populi]